MRETLDKKNFLREAGKSYSQLIIILKCSSFAEENTLFRRVCR